MKKIANEGRQDDDVDEMMMMVMVTDTKYKSVSQPDSTSRRIRRGKNSRNRNGYKARVKKTIPREDDNPSSLL